MDLHLLGFSFVVSFVAVAVSLLAGFGVAFLLDVIFG